ITVTNRGPDTAQDVVAAEVQAAGSRPLDLKSTKGTCEGDRPARCTIGTLDVGQRAVITVTVPAGAPGRLTNRVAAVSSTGDPNLRNNAAAATLTVRRPATPRVTG